MLKVGAEVDEVSVQEPYIVGSDSILETIRVAREINNLNNNQENDINKATASDDQQAEPSEKEDQKSEAAESPAFDELTLDSLEDDKNHDKRFEFMIDLGCLKCRLINYESKQIPKLWRWCWWC